MTKKEAESELMQLYGSLSEEKKKALDVAFKAMEQADNIPVMYYPQVDGITPTVVAQADGEKNCFNCKWYPDNGITKGFDEVCHKCSNSDKWEGLIKRAPWEDIAPPPKIPEAQADGEYISSEKLNKWIPVSEPPKELGTYLIQTDGEPYMCQCRWTDVNPFWTDYKTKPHWNIFDLPQYSKVVAWMPLPEPYRGEQPKIIKCPNCGNVQFADKEWCPDCGAKMVDERESEE